MANLKYEFYNNLPYNFKQEELDKEYDFIKEYSNPLKEVEPKSKTNYEMEMEM